MKIFKWIITFNTRWQNFDFLNGKLVYTKHNKKDDTYQVYQHHWWEDKKIGKPKKYHGQSWGYDNGVEYLLEYNEIFGKNFCHGGVQNRDWKVILNKTKNTNKITLYNSGHYANLLLPSSKHTPQSLMVKDRKIYITTSVFFKKDDIYNYLLIYERSGMQPPESLNKYIPKWLKPFTKNIEAEGSRYHNGKKLIGLTVRLKWLKRTYINFIYELED